MAPALTRRSTPPSLNVGAILAARSTRVVACAVDAIASKVREAHSDAEVSEAKIGRKVRRALKEYTANAEAEEGQEPDTSGNYVAALRALMS